MKKMTLYTWVTLGLLLAMQVVLTRFLSISAWNIRIGFGFVPVVIAAVLYGPIPAAILGGAADFLGAILFPSGPFFPGFTLTAALTGLVWGLFLWKKSHWIYSLLAVLIVQFVLGLLLNTYWISFLYGSSFTGLLATRVVQAAVLCVVQFICVRLIVRFAPRLQGLSAGTGAEE